MRSEYIPSLIAMLICIILSAYFSATETAFSSLNKTRIKVLMEKGSKKANLTYKLVENYDKLISTVLIGNNIVNIAVSSIATLLFVQILGNIGATVSTVVITIVVLIFGEITPKSVAKDYPEKFAMFSAPFINFLILAFTPLNFLFSAWKKLVSKLFKSGDDMKMSQEELLMMLEEAEQEGGLNENEGELLRNAVEFGDLVVKDILTHRVDLEAVSIDATKKEIAAVFTESHFSRLLVYENSIDNIVGVLHLKDFYKGTGITDAPVRKIMTPPLFIHQTEKVDKLLQMLQSSKSHMAVVIDEYGGTLGVVTMEDILEELVGEIWDEHDEVENPIQKVDAQTYIVDGAVTLDDFCASLDMEIESDSVSVGGWIMEELGRIPDEGDSFQYKNLTVTVTKTEEHRVESVTVALNEIKSEKEA